MRKFLFAAAFLIGTNVYAGNPLENWMGTWDCEGVKFDPAGGPSLQCSISPAFITVTDTGFRAIGDGDKIPCFDLRMDFGYSNGQLFNNEGKVIGTLTPTNLDNPPDHFIYDSKSDTITFKSYYGKDASHGLLAAYLCQRK